MSNRRMVSFIALCAILLNGFSAVQAFAEENGERPAPFHRNTEIDGLLSDCLTNTADTSSVASTPSQIAGNAHEIPTTANGVEFSSDLCPPVAGISGGSGSHIRPPIAGISGGSGSHIRPPIAGISGGSGSHIRPPIAGISGGSGSHIRPPIAGISGGSGSHIRPPIAGISGGSGSHIRPPIAGISGGSGSHIRPPIA